MKGLEAPTGRDGGQNSYGVRQDSYEVTPPDRPVHIQPPDLIDGSARRHPKGPVALRVRPNLGVRHHHHVYLLRGQTRLRRSWERSQRAQSG